MATGIEKAADTTVLPEAVSQKNSATVPSTSNLSTQSLVDQASLFIAHADNATLIAISAGFIAVAYVLLGRLALLLLGAVGGIILHIWWEGREGGPDGDDETVRKRRRQELSLEVANRLTQLYTRGIAKVDEDEDALLKAEESALDYSMLGPATSAALTALTDSVIGNYVNWWYQPILPSEAEFPKICRKTFVGMVLAVSSRISRKRPADIFLQFATNSTSFMIVFFSELSAAVGASAAIPSSVADSINDYLEKNPSSSLASVLSSSQQEKKLGLVGTDILETFLEPSVYNCPPLRVFLREVISRLVLQMTIDMCSDAEYINTWIVYFLEEGEPQLMNAIDAGLEQAEGFKQKGPVSTQASDPNLTRDKHPDATPILERPEQSHAAPPRNVEHSSRFEAREDDPVAGSTGPTENTSISSASQNDNDIHVQIPKEQSSSSTSNIQATPISSVEAHPIDVPTAPTSGQANAGQQPTAIQALTLQTLQLHGSSVSILEDFSEDVKATLRSKPTGEYLIQIEPKNSKHTGWMIARKYSDFEILHETLRRISVVSGISDFSLHHNELPGWKGRTRNGLRVSLEQYLQTALRYERLAECEGMRRFLEKGRQSGLAPDSASGKSGFPFAAPAAVFENMGKGMMGVLGTAPKGVANSKKAIVDGVSGIFGASGGNDSRKRGNSNTPSRPSSVRGASIDIQPSPTSNFMMHSKNSSLSSLQEKPRQPVQLQPTQQESEFEDSQLEFPPPDLQRGGSLASSRESLQDGGNVTPQSSDTPDNVNAKSSLELDDEASDKTCPTPETNSLPNSELPSKRSSETRTYPPLSEEESIVVVELLFAVINEVYSLSSAWNIRKRLLNASKSFLLRPGNPSLEAIRTLLQDSVIDGNTSDEALAGYITKLRQSSMPTEEELKAYPPPLSSEQKEQLRVKARALLISRGMPPALMGIMGANATGEALGKIFDCLQIPSVGRAFVFAILLQAIRVVTQ